MAKLEFIRSCPVCGNKVIEDKYKIIKHVDCEKCGAKLSAYEIYRCDRETVAESSVAVDTASASPIAETLVSQIRRNNEFTDFVDSYSSNYDPFSSDAAEFDSMSIAGQGDSTRPTANAIPEPKTSTIAVCSRIVYALELRGGPITIELTPFDGEGIVGRSFAGGTALASLLTVSRRQFSYRYLPDGRLRITNLSRFGTVVDNRLLNRDEATGTAQQADVVPPATLTMGGQIFDLVVAHD